MKLVLSQSHQNVPKRRDTEQDLVASLLMRDRIEVILVEDVAQLENESTDALCIRGIRGDMLVVAWHQTAVCVEHLRRLGIIGKFGGEAVTTSDLPIALPSGQYDAMLRRIVCLNLNTIDDPSSARQQILTLRRRWKECDQVMPPATVHDPISTDVPRQKKPVKPMPKRSEESSTLDDLDRLLDEIDGANL
jgi:hypothetical protein